MNEASSRTPELGIAGVLLAGAAAVAARLERSVSEASGLTVAQLWFLHHVDRHGGALPLGRVAECLSCVRSNVTQLADRLEVQGLIEREPDPADRRSVRAVLTDEGRERLRRGERARVRIERELAETLPPADRYALVGAIERLVGKGR